ncbi:MAG TPA: hypothetical protein VGA69_05750 [Nitriliruptorales bacterium]
MTDWRPLNQLADQQHRVIARSQVVELGLPVRTVEDRARREAWASPHSGVWVLGTGTPTRWTVASAALAAVGPPAALTRWWALWAHGLAPMAPSRVQVVVPHGRRASASAGIDVLRSRTLTDPDVARVRGLPVTTLPRTLLDLAPLVDDRHLRDLLITAQQRRLTTVEAVATRAIPAISVPGRGRLLRVAGELDAAQVDSVFELDVRWRLEGEGFVLLPGPRYVPVRVGVTRQLDIVLADAPVGVECDSIAYHSSPDDLERDAIRHNEFALAGYTVLRLTWRRYRDAWPAFVHDLRQARQDRLQP